MKIGKCPPWRWSICTASCGQDFSDVSDGVFSVCVFVGKWVFPPVADEEDGGISSTMENVTEGEDAAPVADYRVIFINRIQPPVPKFVNNRVSTAKYRWVEVITHQT